MSNDRVFIKCKGCGRWNLLLKHMGAGSYTKEGRDILDWLDSHAECHPRCYAGDLDGDPGFELHTEDAIGEALLWENRQQTPEGDTNHD